MRQWESQDANVPFVYLEEPEYGEEKRDDERHRQIREGMTADNRTDRFEKRC